MATILVVDDRATNRDVLTTLLGYGGHRLIEAADGQEALELAHRERPDVVISDVAMPIMDGFQLASKLRGDPATATVGIVFYTAVFHEERARALARDCGVEHVLIKPSDPATILGVVESLLRARSIPAAAPPNFSQDHRQLVADTLVEKVAELETSNLRLSTLLEFGREFANNRTPAEVLAFAAGACRRLTGAKSAAIFLVDQATGNARRAMTNPAEPVPGALWPDEMREPLGLSHADGCEPVQAVPIPWGGSPMGWLCLSSRHGGEQIAEGDKRLAAGIVALFATAYRTALQDEEIRRHINELEQRVGERTAELAVLNERLAREAITDPLTGLYNRGYMDDLLAREFSRARRARSTVALVLADIDHFKRVNDTLGHQAGDAVLRDVATLLASQIRREDAVCRYGGEEFLVVLPGANAENALRRAEAFRRALVQRCIEHEGKSLEITLSLGLGIFPDNGDTPDEVLGAADRALYRAKSGGRNRSVIAGGEG